MIGWGRHKKIVLYGMVVWAKIKMKEAEIVKDNFSLLRWIHGTHKELVEKVGNTSTWKKLSDYALGNAIPASYERKLIEQKVDLPEGWTSRNNKALLELSADDFALVEALLCLDDKTKRALKAFADSANLA